MSGSLVAARRQAEGELEKLRGRDKLRIYVGGIPTIERWLAVRTSQILAAELDELKARTPVNQGGDRMATWSDL